VGDTWRQIGVHRYQLADEISLWEPHGVITRDDAQQLTELLLEQARQHGAIFLLLDAHGHTQTTQEARSFYIQTMREQKVLIYFAMYHSSLVARTTLTMLTRAAMLLTASTVHAYFAKSEADAREFLERERNHHRAARKQATR
jgi:hypothetical protein